MSDSQVQVVVAGAFDDPRAGDFRFLQEAARLGQVSVWLWPDELAESISGSKANFSLAERQYFLQGVRYASRVFPLRDAGGADTLPPALIGDAKVWIDRAGPANESRRAFCRQHQLQYRVIEGKQMTGFPISPTGPSAVDQKKIFVTGTFDWLHSGHVRFFEEAAELGELYVSVGNDENIRLLKGAGHPLLPEAERAYMVASIRYVHQAIIATGAGWLDAEQEILRLKPDIYAVNEDGDREEKREFCRRNGIEYIVLQRTPAPGLPRRSSTALRGF